MTGPAFGVPASLAYRAAVMGSAAAALVASGLIEQSGPTVIVGASLVAPALRTLWIGARLLGTGSSYVTPSGPNDVTWEDVGAVETVDTPFRFVAGGLGLRRRTTMLRRRDGRAAPGPRHAASRWHRRLVTDDEPTTVIEDAWRTATASPRGTLASPS